MLDLSGQSSLIIIAALMVCRAPYDEWQTVILGVVNFSGAATVDHLALPVPEIGRKKPQLPRNVAQERV